MKKEEILESITGVLSSDKPTHQINIPIGWIHQAMQQYSDVSCVGFTEWLQDGKWKLVHSKKLDKSLYVDIPVLTHGSDFYFTDLINKHGKSLQELLENYKYQNK